MRLPAAAVTLRVMVKETLKRRMSLLLRAALPLFLSGSGYHRRKKDFSPKQPYRPLGCCMWMWNSEFGGFNDKSRYSVWFVTYHRRMRHKANFRQREKSLINIWAYAWKQIRKDNISAVNKSRKRRMECWKTDWSMACYQLLMGSTTNRYTVCYIPLLSWSMSCLFRE